MPYNKKTRRKRGHGGGKRRDYKEHLVSEASGRLDYFIRGGLRWR